MYYSSIHNTRPFQVPSVLLIMFAGLFLNNHISAQESSGVWNGYLTFPEIEQRLNALADKGGVKLKSLGKTIEGRDIWLVEISPPADGVQKPAILVLGNVHAPHLVGRELSLRMAEHLVRESATDEKTKSFLEKFTVYIIPVPSPDAAEKNLRKPYREVSGNAVITDDDRDFSFGEDPPVDLNGDNWITFMRVRDSLGTHRTHPTDPRVLIEVDRGKNEPAEYRLFTEAKDMDGDKGFGEDAGDGVDFNRNFTFNYPYFGKGAGPHQVSESETRAIADFAFDHPNIGVVFCFSPEDNLFHPWKGSARNDAARIKTEILTKDSVYTDYLAKLFQKHHGGKDAPKPSTGAGSFSEWAYFHFGRWSFASRGWWIPKTKTEESKVKPAGDNNEKKQDQPAESTAEIPATETEESVGGAESARVGVEKSTEALAADDKRGAEDLDALAWFAANSISGFVDWQEIEHPDFPDRVVEVGGFKPFYRLNPPGSLIDDLVQPHVDFLVEFEAIWPSLEVREFVAIELAPGLYDVKCKITNTGFLPTMPAMGEVGQVWYPIQVTLNVPENARWISGSPRQRVGRLDGQGGTSELHWLFQLPESLGAEHQFLLHTWSPTLHRVDAEVRVKPHE
ncbi:MAG TPA: M14 family metallopeptidase [Pirellulaceae bacterium]|nr:M14 family metallopeptidase [Pirellulaceae bacterium]HMP68105.1 M14 family metallopeptidase [Pirellulaceae bacterium]